MTEKRRERLDFFQNVTIAALAVSAALLLVRTQIVSQVWHLVGGYVQVFPVSAAVSDDADTPSEPVSPLRLVVSGPFGRHADTALHTDSPAFYPVRRLLQTALAVPPGSTPEDVSPEDFLRAAAGPSLYCDFLHPLPLTLLAGLCGASTPREDTARRILLSRTEDGAALYLWDGGTVCSRFPADISPEAFDAAAESFALGGASFAMDLAERDPLYSNVSPLSILPRDPPDLPILTVSSGPADADRLLAAMRFNAMTNSRYWESTGTEVIMDNGRSVRLREDGSVSYQSGGRADLRVEGAEETPTLWECAAGCWRLLETMMPAGSASLYLTGAERDGALLVLRYGFQYEGIPIRFSDGGDAALAVVDNGSILSLELRPRSYGETTDRSLCLPLPQALGVAGLRTGGELSTAYVDDDSGAIHAGWVTEPDTLTKTGQQ